MVKKLSRIISYSIGKSAKYGVCLDFILSSMMEIQNISPSHSVESTDTALVEIIQKIEGVTCKKDFQNLEELLGWLKGLNWNGWLSYVRFQEKKYCRVPLCEDEKFDLLLVCWLPGQRSHYHSHPKQGCLVRVLQGSLEEHIQKSDGTIHVSNYDVGDTTYICDKIGQHQVTNITNEPAVSLHIYAPGHYRPSI